MASWLAYVAGATVVGAAAHAVGAFASTIAPSPWLKTSAPAARAETSKAPGVNADDQGSSIPTDPVLRACYLEGFNRGLLDQRYGRPNKPHEHYPDAATASDQAYACARAHVAGYVAGRNQALYESRQRFRQTTRNEPRSLPPWVRNRLR